MPRTLDPLYQLWANGTLWRMAVVHPQGNTYSLRFSSGKSSDMAPAEIVNKFGLKEAYLLLSSHGKDQWFYDLGLAGTQERIKAWQARVSKAGFTKLGTSP